MRLNKLQQTAVSALEDIKARDIKVLDVRKLTSFYDCLIIASADSNRQVKALAHHVRDKLKEAGASILGIEGEETGEWVLVDCGDIVVHVMQPAVRAYYNLEELWDTSPAQRRARAALSVPELREESLSPEHGPLHVLFGEIADRRAWDKDAGLGGRRLRRLCASACRAISRSISSS